MKTFSDMRTELDEQKKRLSELQQQRNDAAYVPCRERVGSAFGAIILSLLAGLFMMVAGTEIMNAQRRVAIIFFFALAGLFLVLALIRVVRHLKGDITPVPAMIILLLSGVLAAAAGLILVTRLMGDSILERLFTLEEDDALLLERYDVYAAAAIALPMGILCIGSLVRFCGECAQKSSCARRFAALTDEVNQLEEDVGQQEAELKQAEADAAGEFSRLLRENNPDVTKIQALADRGLAPAADWLREKEAAEKKAEGRRVYAQALAQGDSAAMQQAAELGNPDACLHLAKENVLPYLRNLSAYARSELAAEFRSFRLAVADADGAQDEDLRYVLRVLSVLLCSRYGNDNQMKTDDMASAAKKIRSILPNRTDADDQYLADQAVEQLVYAMDKAEEAARKAAAEEAARPKQSAADRLYEEAMASKGSGLEFRDKLMKAAEMGSVEAQNTLNRIMARLRCRYDLNGLCSDKISSAFYGSRCPYRGDDQLFCSNYIENG